MSALGSRRFDVPAGQVPDYRTFCRFVWQYKDDDGQSAIHAPPWMYSMIIADPKDVSSANAIVAAVCLNNPEAVDFIEMSRMEYGVKLSFSNLSTLHTALSALARCGAESEDMRRLAEFLLWTLGFRWV